MIGQLEELIKGYKESEGRCRTSFFCYDCLFESDCKKLTHDNWLNFMENKLDKLKGETKWF